MYGKLRFKLRVQYIEGCVTFLEGVGKDLEETLRLFECFSRFWRSFVSAGVVRILVKVLEPSVFERSLRFSDHSLSAGVSMVVLAVAVVTLGGLVFGYELGVASGALLQLRFNLSCVQQEVLVSALLVGGVLASMTGGWLLDWYGRRASVLLSNTLTIGGSLVLSLSTSFWLLVAGRVVSGFAASLSSMSCCILVSETVRAGHRGLIVTLYEVGVAGGILLAYSVSLAFSDAQAGWRYMFGAVMVPALVQALAVWVLPIQQAAPGQDMEWEGHGSDSARSLFGREKNMRVRMLMGLGLVVFQQLSGQPNILLYAATVFQSAGFKSATNWAPLCLGLVKLAATLLATLCADRAGRRPLLIGGCSIMAAGLLMLSFLIGRSALAVARRCDSLAEMQTDARNITASTDRTDQLEASHWMILICMMMVVAAFSVGFGPSE